LSFIGKYEEANSVLNEIESENEEFLDEGNEIRGFNDLINQMIYERKILYSKVCKVVKHML